MIKISESVLNTLEKRIATGLPDLATDSGELFVVPGDSVAAIVPKPNTRKGMGAFLASLQEQPLEKRPKYMDVIPTENPRVPLVIPAEVVIQDSKTFIDGKEVILLP